MNKNSVKTEKKQKKRGAPEQYLFKSGQSGNPKGRPKGKKDFFTDFELAAREVAEALRLGKEPDKVMIELLKTGIKAGLKEKFPFWKELLERKYGKVPDEVETKVEGLKEIIVKIVRPKENGKDRI